MNYFCDGRSVEMVWCDRMHEKKDDESGKHCSEENTTDNGEQINREEYKHGQNGQLSNNIVRV